MKVGDVLDIVPYGANDIAFHDLHVVDVVKQFDARRIDSLHDLDAPRRLVALVVGVIDLTVEKLHDDRDPEIFGLRLDFVEQPGGVVPGLFVFYAAPIA